MATSVVGSANEAVLEGKHVSKDVWYDWVPEYCHTCLQVGHDCSSKQARRQAREPKQGSKPQEKQYDKPKPKPVEKFRKPVQEWHARPEVVGANVNIAPGDKPKGNEQQAMEPKIVTQSGGNNALSDGLEQPLTNV
ncbi:hypothetical protein K7X08_001186 [Anisodus acutangulus]|uniref:Uncharacterized protein n=1 Tax=Anisodus acutangulus TaxID=402998 RepID=A0A9Q1RNA6_9SOLA|nr:hypothetical protein K7X08_001186 [Anisodus acutangulus]